MASPSIASYFNIRKRAAAEDIVNARNKLSKLETTTESSGRAQALVERAILAKNKLADAGLDAKIIETAPAKVTPVQRRTTRRTVKRTAVVNATETADSNSLKQQKIVKFTLGGSLSPRKKSISSPSKAFKSIARNASNDAITTTPTKQSNTDESKPSTSDGSNKANIVNKNLTNVRKELSFDEIKAKIGRSSRLDDLKAILNKRQQLEEQYQACISKRNAKQMANSSPAKLDGQSLKEFDTIELEVLSRYVNNIFYYFVWYLQIFNKFYFSIFAMLFFFAFGSDPNINPKHNQMVLLLLFLQFYANEETDAKYNNKKF